MTEDTVVLLFLGPLEIGEVVEDLADALHGSLIACCDEMLYFEMGC